MTHDTTPAADTVGEASPVTALKRGWIGLVQVGSCASASYFDEFAMERSMQRAEAARAESPEAR